MDKELQSHKTVGCNYCQTSNISCTKSPNLNGSCRFSSIVTIMVAEDLAMQGARSSTAMVLLLMTLCQSTRSSAFTILTHYSIKFIVSNCYPNCYFTQIDFKQKLTCCLRVNSLRPSDAIWQQRTGSTLAQVMACCLTAPSHYLNQCWLIISKVMWLSCEGNFTIINY